MMAGTQLCIRWTIGDVSPRGFESLALSIWGAWRLFGDDARYCVCVNTISVDQARERTGQLPGETTWRKVTHDDLPLFIRAHLDEGLAEGVAWKLAPLRIAPQAFELALDNDLIMWGQPTAVRTWLVQDSDVRAMQCLLATDVKRAYGRFDRHCSGEALNSGMRGLPPGVDFEGSLKGVLQWAQTDSPGLALSSELDEQGLQVAAASVHGPPLAVSQNEVTTCSPFPPHRAELGTHGAHFVGLNAKHIPWEYYGRPADDWMTEHWNRYASICRERVGAPGGHTTTRLSGRSHAPVGRALVLVLDSVGAGAASDAHLYGDSGADTLGHILEKLPGTRLPTLMSLGLGSVLGRDEPASGSFGRMCPRSAGKDSTTGHWELAGVILDEPFATFDRFPKELVRAIEEGSGTRLIGNKAASGTAIIEELGEEHLRTGKLILYTSADSVLQIAAHDGLVPVERLYEVCRVAREHANGYRIGRVIARPFTGQAGSLRRTSQRHDLSIPPPRTALDALVEAGITTIGVGKTGDLFNQQGLMESHATTSNAQGMQLTRELWDQMTSGLLFTNLVDFDTLYGHRRDVNGYAAALCDFDRWLAGFLEHVRPDDLVVITADHGNDPTFRGTDHTREEVPLLVLHGREIRELGERGTFADVAASLCDFFDLEPWSVGTSFLNRRAGECVAHGSRARYSANARTAGRAA